MSDEQLQALSRDSPESLELRRQPVDAGARSNSVDAPLVSHRREFVAGGLMHGGDRDARKYGAAGIRHGAAQHGFLCERNCWN